MSNTISPPEANQISLTNTWIKALTFFRQIQVKINKYPSKQRQIRPLHLDIHIDWVEVSALQATAMLLDRAITLVGISIIPYNIAVVADRQL